MATRGRPTQFQIAAQLGKSWRTVVELGEDNRLPIPVDATRRAAWLGRGMTVLAILGEEDGVTLRPYETYGKRVEEILADLAARGTDEAERQILAIRATRLRLAIYDDGRMVVPGDIRMSLGLSPAGAFYLSLTVQSGNATLKANGPREISEAADLLETIDFEPD